MNLVNFLLLNEDAFQLDHLLLYVDIEMCAPRFNRRFENFGVFKYLHRQYIQMNKELYHQMLHLLKHFYVVKPEELFRIENFIY